jgi:hypothetical protein
LSFVDLSGIVGGVGTLMGTLTQTYLMGAQVRGLGSLTDDWAVSLSGTLSGAGSLAGEALRVYYLTGHVQGSSTLDDSVPLPLQGYGILSSYLEVFSPPPPYCRADTRKAFPYGWALQQSDLTFCAGPGAVTYAIYEVLPDHHRVLRGPANRVPGYEAGTYYATGYIGQDGQPGDWLIVWTYPGGTCQESFRVNAGPPMTNPCGRKTYGWD